jgi:hypothetical protein
MFENWQAGWLAASRTLDQILTAGVSITALSLLLYALTFNLRDRVARSFALILACVVVIFSAEAFGTTSDQAWEVILWLKFQWFGIIFLPATYLHFSDALLATTGQPSRGRRRWAVRLIYLFSLGFVIALQMNLLVGSLVTGKQPTPHLMPTPLTNLFTAFYGIVIIVAWLNFARAFRRTITHASRRRMIYLMAGSTAPALGSYPYLLFGSDFFTNHPLIFWSVATITSAVVITLIIIMAYSVAFFGTTWPDRVVKARLFKWLMRGPVTASIALGLTTIVRRTGAVLGTPYTAAVPIVMVSIILLMEHFITIFGPLWEKWLFYGRGKDREDLTLLKTLEDRLLTNTDLRQFLEVILAAVCDRLQTSNAFVASLNGEGLALIVTIGENSQLESQVTQQILSVLPENRQNSEVYRWGGYSLMPLVDLNTEDEHHLLGMMGFGWPAERDLDIEQLQALEFLAKRAALALRDRRMQQQVVSSLKVLGPQVAFIQEITAAARYDGSAVMQLEKDLPTEDFTNWVREALTHYWGGPKLTESPLMRLQVVRDAMQEHDGNNANALRAVLRKAIDQAKPEGERRFTAEWILYNILEMKFLEGRKVREVALRLAMSEADLYRKQRVAIEMVAKAILEMEEQAARR